MIASKRTRKKHAPLSEVLGIHKKVNIIRYLIIFPFLLPSIVSAGDTSPPSNYIDKGACPFECCSYREWVVKQETRLLSSHEQNSQPIAMLTKGAKVDGITGVVKVKPPGKVKVLRSYKSPASNIVYKKGDVVWVYTYLGEGFYKVWFNGSMHDEEIFFMAGQDRCEDTGTCWGKELAKPKTVWWVKIGNRKGIEGWTDKPQNFSNKDACG